MSFNPEQPTQMLRRMQQGDADAAQRLLPVLYDEFRRLAAHYMQQERPDHTLNATSLVHEAYMKLVGQQDVEWQSRTHFFAVGAQAMRRILVDHARQKRRQKRGGAWNRVQLEDHEIFDSQSPVDLVDLDDALEQLAALDPRQARIVELRFFGGLEMQEIANQLNVSKRTVENDWSMARAWLSRQLEAGSSAA